jgi:hypothetical protein
VIQHCFLRTPPATGGTTDPGFKNPQPELVCIGVDTTTVTAPAPPGIEPNVPTREPGIPTPGGVPTGPIGHPGEPGGGSSGGSADGDGAGGCTEADGSVHCSEEITVEEKAPSPRTAGIRQGQWWPTFFRTAWEEGSYNQWQEGGCGRLFYETTRDALNPFSLSPASAGESVGLVWGAHTYNQTLQYAASRPNYLGGRGLVYPMKSSVFRAGVQTAKLRAASGPLIQANLAIYHGLVVEMAALYQGQCR